MLPVLYTSVQLQELSSLDALSKHLQHSESRWDSIRRIPYSAPGRWLQSLDLTEMSFMGQDQALGFDTALTYLFPLVPFLHRLAINPSFVLSRRALTSLAHSDAATSLRRLEGVAYVPVLSQPASEDPLVYLTQYCVNLEELEVIGHGSSTAELDFTPFSDPSEGTSPLCLSRLRVLTIIKVFASPLIATLLHTPLPSLTKLAVTPYDDIPYPASQVSALIREHGHNLKSLLLLTPNSWPTRRHPSPTDLFQTCVNLRHLSLEMPIPPLRLQSDHSLQILSVPRPIPETWGMLNTSLKYLPRLSIVRIRDVRWLRKGMNTRAQATGVQGEMQEWRRRLERWRIRLVDADWKDGN